MFKFIIATSCLLAVTSAFFDPMRQIYTLHNGRTVNFGGLDLQGVCRQAIMAMGGRPTDQLSDMMVTAVQNLQRIHGNNIAAIAGKDPMWTCLASRSPGGMMANAVGDYFDTAVESLHRPINPFGYCNVGCGEAGINAAALGQNLQLFSGMSNMFGAKPNPTAGAGQTYPATGTAAGAFNPMSAMNPMSLMGMGNPMATNPMFAQISQMFGTGGGAAKPASGGSPSTGTGTATATTGTSGNANTPAGSTNNIPAAGSSQPAPTPSVPSFPGMGPTSMLSQLTTALRNNPFTGGLQTGQNPAASVQDMWRMATVFGPDGLLQDGPNPSLMGLDIMGLGGAGMGGMGGMGGAMGGSLGGLFGGGLPGSMPSFLGFPGSTSGQSGTQTSGGSTQPRSTGGMGQFPSFGIPNFAGFPMFG